ncbi:laminin subunit beta-3 [Periophthalmus magnuspinnatus]|uniref:laminin subunit beta-3 n=1 Tax=Periophthalmus magnuspinnatus TaxID=409849 RepID=UPI00145A3A23|nr:laminin subunit beta-3 [Periophthalmus magnuspinnatus]
MILVFLLAALAAVSQATSSCLLGACYPPSGDLVLGRTQQLSASSTCGLTGSEVYCTPYQQRRMKCCPCDSRNPEGQLAHTIQDVLSTAGPDRWWQSQKGVSPVTIQLDLKNLFQLDSLVLDFKGPRPQALVIERTLDNGRTWQPYVYMATHCPSAFPGVPTSTPLKMDDIYCYTLPPVGYDLYKDHQIHFRPLEQYMYVPVPKDQKIEEISGLTGLRVKLVQLGEVPEIPGRSLSRFFALKEMRVVGRCMCHGHANKCLPDTYTTFSNNIQVHSRCDCQHNTAGLNCERCADLYNDLPWRAAEEGNPHVCKRCECNNHAQRCRFDRAVYEASGRRSGGVCIDCMHHTTGPKCDQCEPGYQPNPLSRMDRPDACIRCVCNAVGTVNGALCDDSSGSCRCKTNVEGSACDRCKQGFYNLVSSNPQGCTKCSCFPAGSVSQNCDPVTGQCPCRPHSTGLQCESCSPGFWRPAGSDRCVPCACDPNAARSNVCDQQTGQCQCRPGFGGRACTECANHMFGDPYRGCKSCDCDREGTFPQGCNKQTGACLCRPGVTGTRCDTCRRDRCDSFPQCQTCPSCFFTLDAQRQNISITLQRLRPSETTGPSLDFGPRINALESSLNNIKNSISLPPAVAIKVDKALVTMDQLQSEMDRVKNNLLPLEKTNLEPELDKLQDLLNSLNLEYKTKSDKLNNATSSTDTGPFSAIENAYNESTDAARNVNTSKKVLQQSSDIREKTEDELNRVLPVNSRNLGKLNDSLASNPDLSPLAKMVCGKVLSDPCTPLQCVDEELCATDNVPPCDPGKPCVGALPLGNKAVDDAEQVQDKLDVLSKKISDAAKKLQKTQESTNLVRQSAEELTNRMKEARDAMEEDLKKSRDVVKELKDFLSDPSSNLTHIQQVSDWVLKAKLPVSLTALKTKLDELKDLASGLPDSTAVLSEAQPQLEAAKKLLQEAQDARDTAKGVKADVDGLVDGMRSMEQSLSDLEDKLQNSMDLIDNLSDNITKVEEQLSPAEKALNDASVLLKPIKPTLDELKNLLEEARQHTLDTQDKADNAEEEATTTAEDMETLEKELETLKAKAAASSPDGNSAELGPRLTKLQQDAMALSNTTDHMFKALDGKADSIRLLQEEIITKSSRLEGLDAKLSDLLAQLRKRAHELRTCQA